ncbi:DNA glycosylase AlkZ-like family protein [Amycolatopsis sp. WAC 04169]|uniref:DNA glycosylase AlkZ-like family protein n=1 Tax=Amycolatopsis sp. WAC 04169 TaxID=2203197 RepID=UPI0013158B49|nr:crosslink repair DNA glycosylase YcaQ family protein [Amycolatopsis sp. WAC 04169]
MEVAAHGLRLLGGGVLTRPELGRALALNRPGADAQALGWTVQYLLPLVHPAPSGTWGKRGATPFAVFPGVSEAATADDVRGLIRRYLAAFGPATVADARTWWCAPVVPLRSISAADRAAIEAEALRLLEFAAPSAVHDVRFSG